MQGLVYRSVGSRYIVQTQEGFVDAGIKGRLKTEAISSTNPVAVGDHVQLAIEGKEYLISSIDERRNHINRVSPHNKNLQHIVASNLDQSLLFATLREPKTTTGFIDRFLVTSEAYHIPAILVFNKADLYKKRENELFERLEAIYGDAGYPVFRISVAKGEGLDALRDQLKNKTTLMSGHSGVGKSSFLNYLFPDRAVKTLEVSDKTGKGMHTTTFAEMYDLNFGGRVIDSPGIRELGLVDIPKQELSHYFPEMRDRLQECKFNNCLHFNEPGCAIKEAVNEGEVSEERYLSYLGMLEGFDSRA